MPKISADFQLGDIDLDALLPKSDTSEEQTAAASSQTQAVEPDLTALNGLDAKLILAVKSIKVANLSTQNWLMDLGIKNGEVDLKQLSADLYQGKLMLNAQVDARSKVASYQFDKQISGVQIQPLLKDAAKLDILAGTANFIVKGNTLIYKKSFKFNNALLRKSHLESWATAHKKLLEFYNSSITLTKS